MSLLRNDKQVALNDLLVSTWKSADQYRDSAEFLEPLPPSATLREIAAARDLLGHKVKEAIEASGDFPSAPDEDRETVEQLFHRVHATLSQDEVRDVVEHHLEADEEFGKIFAELSHAGVAEEASDLLDASRRHLRWSRQRLNAALQTYLSGG